VSKWRIVGEPIEESVGDSTAWTWPIERGGEGRTVTILVSETLLAATGHPSRDAAEARRTRGRNYVEAVLELDTPPRSRRAITTRTLPDNLVDEWD
jgi:hypothetical protein